MGLNSIQQKTPESLGFTGVLCTAPNCIEQVFGGAGGNRTPVRKPSTDSSTYLAVLFDLT